MTLSMIIIYIQTSRSIIKTLLGQFVIQLNIIFQTINVLGWFVVQLDIVFQTRSVFFKLVYQLYTYSKMRNYSSIQFIYIFNFSFTFYYSFGTMASFNGRLHVQSHLDIHFVFTLLRSHIGSRNLVGMDIHFMFTLAQ